MFYKLNKKAQGEIITTVLIILLVLAAIVIVWQVIRGTVEKGAEEVESQAECIGLNIDITNIVAATNTVTPDGSVTIRPSKTLSAFNVYVKGVFEAKGPSVDAYKTGDVSGLKISKGDEIEVFGVIGDKVCEVGGVKKTAP